MFGMATAPAKYNEYELRATISKFHFDFFCPFIFLFLLIAIASFTFSSTLPSLVVHRFAICMILIAFGAFFVYSMYVVIRLFSTISFREKWKTSNVKVASEKWGRNIREYSENERKIHSCKSKEKWTTFARPLSTSI